MTAFTADVLQAAIVDLTWRSSAIIALVWLITTWVPFASARHRRNLWALALGVIGVYVVVSVALGVRQMLHGPAPVLDTVFLLGDETLSISVPTRTPPVPLWQVVLLVGSIFGVLTSTARLVIDRRRAAGVVRRATLEDDLGLHNTLRALTSQGDRRHTPRVLRSSEIASAAVHGWWRPTILVSEQARCWDAARQQQVLSHEWAHIRAHDIAIAVIVRLVRAALWWNPLVTLAARRLEREREFACDEAVLDGGFAPSAYAETLLDVALWAQQRPTAHALRADSASLPERIAAVLRRSDTPVSTSPSAFARVASQGSLPLVVLLSIVIGAVPPYAAAPRAPSRQLIDAESVPRGVDGRRRVRISFDDNGRVVARPVAPDSSQTH